MFKYFLSIPYPRFKLAIVGLITLNALVFVSYVHDNEWLDVYDATLWIVAFASIEVDIFQLLQRV